jgi:hypothetical protein
MIEATARFETGNGQKYLEQMCKHFAHKVEVIEADGHAECRFSCGIGKLEAGRDALLLRVSAGSEAEFAETRAVMEDHLLRFAFKEKPEPLLWTKQHQDA